VLLKSKRSSRRRQARRERDSERRERVDSLQEKKGREKKQEFS